MTSTIEIINSISLEAPADSENPGAMAISTDRGSSVIVTPGALQLSGFSGFTTEQQSTWDLDRATLGRHGSMLHLVVPNVLNRHSTWVPIAMISRDDQMLRPLLQQFVHQARELLSRPLAPGSSDRD